MGQRESKGILDLAPDEMKENLEAFSPSSPTTRKLSIHFKEIDKRMILEIVPDMRLDNFKSEFTRIIRLPSEAEMSFFQINTRTNLEETLTSDHNLSSVNSELIARVITNNDLVKIVEANLVFIVGDNLEIYSVKSFNFLPLKFMLPQFQEPNKQYRVFRSQDTQLSDPLDVEKSLLDYECDELKIMLLVYVPDNTDFVKLSVHFKDQIKVVDFDKFMRISELTKHINDLLKGNFVLCSFESGLKINDKFTIGTLVKTRKTYSVQAQEFEEYYKHHDLERPSVLAMSSEVSVKENVLDQPD